MERDLYRRAKQIFLDVSGLPPEERASAIRKACEDHAALRAEVESLLEHHEAASEATDAATVARSEQPDSLARGVIGPYRILGDIGTGGMGVVYLALSEGDHFRRQVAIKVLKRGMETADVLRRFELERQVLEALNHPGIARLYDAGQTADGLPYFVMEHIEGQSIDQYCDTHRLHVAERLELFRKVCAAVHYAHQNLVVHRDLKPGNILVTKDGEVKLLDFGIAKVINPEFSLVIGAPTAREFRVMTPEYASPEQVRGEMITTASDVYALGVLLYELVSGHRPYRLESRVRAEMERVICDEDPEKPSTAISRVDEVRADDADPDSTRSITPESVSRTRESRPERLRRELAGDIDNIVLRAMRKEPQRRYVSAEQLAEDIRRHLVGLPVIARPDTASYRLGKFIRRNRAGVAVAAVIAVLLVGGVAALTVALREAETQRGTAEAAQVETENARQELAVALGRAETQRDLAERRFDEGRKLARTFMYEFNDTIAPLDGSLTARELVVTTALEYLDSVSRDYEDDPGLARELADAYDRVGELIGGIRNPSFGGVDEALEKHRIAYDIRRDLLKAAPDDLDLELEIAASHRRMGDVLRTKGDWDKSLAEYRSMLASTTRVLQARPEDVAARRRQLIAHEAIADCLIQLGDRDGALDRFGSLIAERRRLVARKPDDDKLQRDLSVTLIRLGDFFVDQGEPQESLAPIEEATRIRDELARRQPENGRARRDLWIARYFLSATYLDLDRAEEALEILKPALADAERRVADNPGSARAEFDLALRHDIVGQAYLELEEWEAAERHYEKFRETISALSEAHAEDTRYRRTVGLSHERLAELRAETGDLDAAITNIRAARLVYDDLSSAHTEDAVYKSDLARALVCLGTWLRETGGRGEAMQALQDGWKICFALYEDSKDDPITRGNLAEAHHELSRLMVLIGDGGEARRHAERTMALTEDPAPELLRDLAAACFLAGDRERAIEAATQALEKLGVEQNPDTQSIRMTLEEDLARYRAQ